MISQQAQRPPREEANITKRRTDFQEEVSALAKSDYIVCLFSFLLFVLGAHKQHYMKRKKKASRLSEHKSVYASGGKER